MLSNEITALVASRLGVSRSKLVTLRERRAASAAAESVAALAQELLALGEPLGIRYLYATASRADLEQALAASPGPLVLLDTAPSGAHRVRILTERVGTRWNVHRLTAGVASARTDAPGALSAGPTVVESETLAAESLGLDAVLLIAARVTALGAAATPSAGPGARLLELLVEERGNVGLVYLYATLVGLFSLTLPIGVQATIGLVSGGLILQPVVILVGFVVLGTLAYGVLQVMQLSVVETIQQRIFARVALDFVTRLPRIAMERHVGEDLTDRMNRFFEVVTVQKSGAKLLVDGTTALLQVVFGLLLLTAYHPYFAFFGIILVALLVLILRLTAPKGLATSLKESSYKYRTVRWLEEMARAAAAFKFAGRTTLPLARMDEQVSGYLHYRRAHFGVLVRQKIAMVVFKTIITGGLLILGSLLVIDRQITLGQFVASELVVVTVIAGIEKLIAGLADVYDLLTSVEKLASVRAFEQESGGGMALTSRAPAMSVELRALGFQYPTAKAPTLQGISLSIAAGERVGVIGVFGSGETTLLRVLSGVYEEHAGTLLYDGITRSDLDPVRLRAQIGVLEPGTALFDGTVAENISLGRDGITIAEVLAALRAVGAHDFVQELPHGVHTEITAGGRTLPATMALRVLLARAIVARPRLLVLDEIFSTLAPRDRMAIAELVTEAAAPWTLVAVSHDDEFLTRCDRVLVLRDGQVVADGPWRVVRRTFAEQTDDR